MFTEWNAIQSIVKNKDSYSHQYGSQKKMHERSHKRTVQFHLYNIPKRAKVNQI